MINETQLLKLFTILTLMMTAAIATNFVMDDNSECESPSVFYHDHGYALIGHVIKTLSLFLADCIEACQANLVCYSLNYFKFPNGTFACELNRSNKKQNPDSFVRKEGYQYSEPSEIKHCDQQGCLTREALPDGWYRLGSSLYKLITENKSWVDARQHCQSLGGDLASFSTETENTFVMKTLLWMFVDMPVPLARYKMDGTDQHLSLLGGAAVVDIDNTKAVLFDGVDDKASVPRVDIRTTDFTIAVWIKPRLPWAQVNTVIDDYDGHSISQFNVYLNHGLLRATLRSVDASLGLGEGGNTPVDQWTYISMTWNRDQKTVKLFQDAIEKQSGQMNSQSIDLPDNPHPVWMIGSREGVEVKSFNGWIRDLIVIPKTLSAQDIQKLKDGAYFGAWIGLNDRGTEGLFQWSDGSPTTFTQTSHTADNTAAKDCVIMVNKEWSTIDCNMKMPFVCKKISN